jgi:hypothetical protein
MNDADLQSKGVSDYRDAVASASGALRRLHSALVNATRALYEMEHGPVAGPSQMLQLLMHDPEFDWLRELSGLMADVDELLDLADVTEHDAATVRVEIERLIAAPAKGTPFGERYREALQSDTDVVIAHGRTRAALVALPPTAEDARSGSTAHRNSWSERRLNERRR